MESRFESILKNKIRKAIQARSEEVVSGLGCKDYPAYQNAVGQISALQEALLLIEETNDDIAKGA